MSLRAHFVAAALLALLVAPAPFVASDGVSAPVVVMTNEGTEPLVKVAPDGTIYIGALQHVYRSTDGGASWTKISPEPYAGTLNLNSDTSLALARDGTLYLAFDWPYAGSTAVCLSTTRGDTWTCNPEAVPGVSDRMWVHALPDGRTVLVTGYALLVSTAFVSVAPGTVVYVPAPGQPVASIGQLGDYATGWGATDTDGVLVAPGTGSPWSLIRFHGSGPLTGSYAGSAGTTFRTNAIPTLARDGAGTLYGLDDSGSSIRLVRNDGSLIIPRWSAFDVVSGGTTRFAALAAGSPGKVAILFYWSPAANGDFYAYKAVSTNANTAAPTFAVAQLSTGIVHRGNVCHSTACPNTDRFAGDIIGVAYGPDDVPVFTWQEGVDFFTGSVMFGR